MLNNLAKPKDLGSGEDPCACSRDVFFLPLQLTASIVYLIEVIKRRPVGEGEAICG